MNDSLSPAAAAVLDAFAADNYGVWLEGDPDRIAAALEAAADQVVPPDPCGDDCCIDLCVGIRAELLAIAAELRAQ